MSLIPDLEKASKRLAHQWPGIDADDIQQEMTVKVLENRTSLERKTGDDQRNLALGLAEKAGVSYCSNERQFYQSKTAEWIYTPKEVRTILANYYFTSEGWEDAPKHDAGQSITGDGVSVACMDLRNAIESLKERDQSVILSVFGSGAKVTDAERKRLDRAVDKIAAYLNRGISERFDHSDHDGPGSRQGLTNTQARHALD